MPLANFATMKATICCLVLPLNFATARLGETPKECEARYGKPIKVEGGMHGYAFKEFTVTIRFVNGKAGLLVFKHKDSKQPISDTEFRTIIKSNGGEKTRIPIVEDNWKAKEAAEALLYINSAEFILITDQPSMMAIRKEEEAEQKDLLKGF